MDYVHDEHTEAQRSDEEFSPFRRALARRQARLAQRRPWLKDAHPFFRDARIELGIRGYGFERLDPNGGRRETWALGSRISFESGRIAERLAVGGTLSTAQKLYGPRDRDGLGMLRPRQTALTLVSHAWADFRLDDATSVRAYRQALDLPFLNGQDSRMIPNSFEAYVLSRRASELSFVAGHVTKMKRRDSREFVSMAEAAGVDAERGLSVVGALWSPREDVSLGVIDLVGWDLMNVLYAEAELGRSFGNEGQALLAAQFAHQASIGDEKLSGGSFSTHQIGLRGQLTLRGLRVTLMGTRTGSGAAVRSPWGGRPGYLSLMRADFDRAGEQAVGLDLGYDFGRLGAEGWSGFVRLARGTRARSDEGQALPTRFELDVTLDYRPASGWLENLWLRLRYAKLWERGAARAGRDVRVILNYEIPLL